MKRSTPAALIPTIMTISTVVLIKRFSVSMDPISLIGHGYWILAENRPEHSGKCDTKCGAILYAEHDRSECINNMEFKLWDNGQNQWTLGKS